MPLRTGAPGSLTSLAITVLALSVAGVVFAIHPELDLAAAALFAGPDHVFVGDTALGRGLRHVFETVPFLVLAAMLALYALRRFGKVAIWSPNTAGALMLATSFALGPGLLVNSVLKSHSHRPRPVQVIQFGGSMPFRPWYATDGDCVTNCSFVSGEGASTMWTVAAGLLMPPQIRAGAVVTAVLFGAAAGTLRMAFGGHFLSDTVFAALLTWLVVVACWNAATSLTGDCPGSRPGR